MTDMVPGDWDANLTALVRRALEEDIGAGDLTSSAVIPAGCRARGLIQAKRAGVVSGLQVAGAVFLELDPELRFTALVSDGDAVGPGAAAPGKATGPDSLSPGNVVATVTGRARSILTAERVALNFLQHLSGIATQTARFVDRVRGTGVRILDTRKTIPGMRLLEKRAVRDGGGVNHRLGLFDAVMIKDNHISAAGGIVPALKALAARPPGVPVIVEVGDLEEVRIAAAGCVDRLLLDNFTPEEVSRAVEIAGQAEREGGRRLEIEISGGITLERVADYAVAGVDFISVGSLTHSAHALDFALDLEREDS